MNNREIPVPEGHATIAQRFNVGLISGERSSPEGTAETAREPSAVPSRLTTGCLSLPNVETLGYCRASLRDVKQIPGALELDLGAMMPEEFGDGNAESNNPGANPNEKQSRRAGDLPSARAVGNPK